MIYTSPHVREEESLVRRGVGLEVREANRGMCAGGGHYREVG